MVLTILADGGSGRQCQVTVGNKEICLEDVEALEFLWKKEDDRSREEVDGQDDDRDRARTKSLLVLNSFFVETFTSEWGTHHRSADGRKRRRMRACCSHVHSAKSHFLIKGLWGCGGGGGGGSSAMCWKRQRGERWGENTNTILVAFVYRFSSNDIKWLRFRS